jgi:hypothetical protein
MSLPKDKAWFAAKRYGWGWGLPARWQGWVVLLAYLCVILVAPLQLEAGRPLRFQIYVAVSTLLLVAICAWKGEPPKWRWGYSRDEDEKL